MRHIEILLEEAREDENDWFKICQRRSAVQIVIDDLGAELTSRVDPEALSRIDSEIRRVGEEMGPVTDGQKPNGLSSKHWWWDHPSK